VMDVELALEARDAADLAAPAARRNQPAAPRRSELGDASPAIVRLANALAQRGSSHERGAVSDFAGRARTAECTQVRCPRWTGLVDGKEIEQPGPLEAAGFTSAPTPAHDRCPGPCADVQANPSRTHVRSAHESSAARLQPLQLELCDLSKRRARSTAKAAAERIALVLSTSSG
jgi:hypothetical protein